MPLRLIILLWALGPSTALANLGGAIVQSGVGSGSIDTGAIGTDAVTSAKILNATIAGVDVAALTLDSTKLATDSVTSAKLLSDSAGLVKVTGGVCSVTSGNMSLASGIFYQSVQNKAALKLNTSGTYVGSMQADAADVWSLGYSATVDNALGTRVLTWSPAAQGGLGVSGAFTVNAASVTLTGDASALIVRGAADTTKFVVTAAGNVGVGTNPSTIFHVDGPGATAYITDSAAVGAGVGGILSFGGNYTGTTRTSWAQIKGPKENATDGEYGGYLAFYTRPNGDSNLERVRITPAGSVGVGTVSPQSSVQVGTSLNATLSYTQIDTLNADTAGPPAAGDCDAAAEVGRMILSTRYSATADYNIWACVQTGAATFAWYKSALVAP